MTYHSENNDSKLILEHVKPWDENYGKAQLHLWAALLDKEWLWGNKYFKDDQDYSEIFYSIDHIAMAIKHFENINKDLDEWEYAQLFLWIIAYYAWINYWGDIQIAIDYFKNINRPGTNYEEAQRYLNTCLMMK